MFYIQNKLQYLASKTTQNKMIFSKYKQGFYVPLVLSTLNL